MTADPVGPSQAAIEAAAREIERASSSGELGRYLRNTMRDDADWNSIAVAVAFALARQVRLLPAVDGPPASCMVPHDYEQFEYPNHTTGFRCRRCGNIERPRLADGTNGFNGVGNQ